MVVVVEVELQEYQDGYLLPAKRHLHATKSSEKDCAWKEPDRAIYGFGWEWACQHPLNSRESGEISITTTFPDPFCQCQIDGLCQSHESDTLKLSHTR